MKNTAICASLLALLGSACDRVSTTAPSSGQVASETRAPVQPTVAPTRAAPAAADPTTTSEAGRARSFDTDAMNAAPPGFSFGRTGSGSQGRWIVRADAGAPSGPNVLAQIDADDTDFRFPVAVMDEPVLRDVRVIVRCKMVSGRVDQACGVVARYRDENNYFITRANALENNIRLYTVRDGQRRQLASWSGRVTADAWHAYVLSIRGDHLEVFWNGERMLDHHDSTFSEAGRAGVWTKSDSVTYFDDLRVEPLP